MNHTLCIVLLLVLLPATAVVEARPAPSISHHNSDEPPRPNIILMMADDLGWGDVGFNGSQVIQTPHLDAMAAAGMRLNRFYSGAPVCSPTRASVLTGRHASRMKIPTANTGHMLHDEVTLPELLRDAGYATGHFGKWHLGTLTTTVFDSNRGGPRGAQHYAPPWEHGYDAAFCTEARIPTYDPMRMPPGGVSKHAWDAIADEDIWEPFTTHYWTGPDKMVPVDDLRGDDSQLIMDRALSFLDARVHDDQTQPVFMVIWFHAPHRPVVAGPDDTALYADHTAYQRNYYGCVTALDRQVGRLRARLRELNVEDNTMLWFCSDNGPEGQAHNSPGSAGPFRGRKRDLYEGGLRGPAVVEWPGHVVAGTSSDVPMVTSDYLPTIVDTLGLSMPDGRPLDGVSLLPYITREDKRRGQAIGFHARKRRSWVTDRHKLITTDDGQSWELYDLIEDPGEQDNIAAVHPDLMTRLQGELSVWMESCAHSADGGDY